MWYTLPDVLTDDLTSRPYALQANRIRFSRNRCPCPWASHLVSFDSLGASALALLSSDAPTASNGIEGAIAAPPVASFDVTRSARRLLVFRRIPRYFVFFRGLYARPGVARSHARITHVYGVWAILSGRVFSIYRNKRIRLRWSPAAIASYYSAARSHHASAVHVVD